jgi:hypothetical protein
MGFIGVVKTVPKRFPMKYLSKLEFQVAGETEVVLSQEDQVVRIL